jgi:DNA-binding NarL/FixJ family response regulator
MLATEIALLSPEFDVVGTAADGAALVSEACRLCPDVIVTIFDMPILSGIDAMRKLQTSGCTARFIFFTLHSEREFLEACMEAGASGYVHKFSMKHHLVPAIKAVLAGRSYVSQSDLAS